MDDVQRDVQGVNFPLEHHARSAGPSPGQASRSRFLAIAIAGAIAIFLLLQAAFTSWRLAILAFATLPLALVGGLVGVLIAGGTLTLGSFAGFAAVLGIAARNGVLIDTGVPATGTGWTWRRGRHRRDRERFASVITTALATIAALVPLVLAGDVAGTEIARPMAIAMIGGLITSTVLAPVRHAVDLSRHGFVARRDDVAEDLGVVLVPEATSDVTPIPGT